MGTVVQLVDKLKSISGVEIVDTPKIIVQVRFRCSEKKSLDKILHACGAANCLATIEMDWLDESQYVYGISVKDDIKYLLHFLNVQ